MRALDHISSDLSPLSDLQLLERVLAHDEAAWRELLRRFRPLMVRCIASALVRHGQPRFAVSELETDEIFADVCIQLLHGNLHKLRSYDPARGTKLSSWLGLLAIHTAYDHLRAHRRRPPVSASIDRVAEPATSAPSALEVLLDRERSCHLRTLLYTEDLSDRDRRFIELYYGQGLSPDEIAAAMGISVKTVYSKKIKIRIKLAALAAS